MQKNHEGGGNPHVSPWDDIEGGLKVWSQNAMSTRGKGRLTPRVESNTITKVLDH